jgi:hypothetical protein
MNILKFSKLVFINSLLIGFLGACASRSPSNSGGTLPAEVVAPPLQGGQVRQWAESAEASSSFADPEWSAAQATGAPDTPRCGDYQTAWATAASDSVDSLELTYPVSVYVTGINIVQSFNPNQVIQVELVGSFGRSITVYEGRPNQIDQSCPYTFSIPLERTEGRFDTLRITVDQSVLGLGWNQIDAVELIGDTE